MLVANEVAKQYSEAESYNKGVDHNLVNISSVSADLFIKYLELIP